MRKRQETIIYIMLISLMLPSAMLYAQDTQPLLLPETVDESQLAQPATKKGLFKRAIERGAATGISLRKKATQVREKLPSLPDTLKKARDLLAQKTHCLIKYSACTKRDKLLISNTFGFMAGYGISYRSLFDWILPKVGIKKKRLLKTKFLGEEFYILEFATLLTLLTGFTGPLFMGRGVASGFLAMWIRGYIDAPDKKAWLAVNKAEVRQSWLLMILTVIEAYMVLQEAAFAFMYDGRLSLLNLGRYLKMNAQCIWNEKYCKPEANAEGRRQGLHFWLGFLEGVALRQLTARIWLPKIMFSPEEKRRISHLSSRTGLEFAWYEVLNVSPRATDREVATAYHHLAGQYHPDSHTASTAAMKKTYGDIMTKIMEANDISKKRMRWIGSFGRSAPPSHMDGLLTSPVP